MGNGFYRSKNPTNSIKVLKEATKENKNNTKNIILREIHCLTEWFFRTLKMVSNTLPQTLNFVILWAALVTSQISQNITTASQLY